MRDFIGTSISRGDWVAHSVRSRPGLRFARVVLTVGTMPTIDLVVLHKKGVPTISRVKVHPLHLIVIPESRVPPVLRELLMIPETTRARARTPAPSGGAPPHTGG